MIQPDTAYIVYGEDRMLLDKGPYSGWRAIQDAYPDYKASLGPWTEAEIVEFMEMDWGGESSWPISRDSIKEFFRAEAKILNENAM